MNRLNQVEGKQIADLDQDQLTCLLKVLLHQEALTSNIPLGAASVPTKICIADGGEDGSIKWDGGPQTTNFLSSRYSFFQIKATDMEPADCGDELVVSDGTELKERVKIALEGGADYILFWGRQSNETMNNRRIDKMRAKLAELGKVFADSARLQIFDADKIADWVNLYFSAQVFVLECRRISVPLGIKTWRHWRQTPEFQGPFFSNDALNSFLSSIRNELQNPRSIVRLTGLSGIGKTRLALEALRESENQENRTQNALSLSSVYYDCRNGNEEQIKDFLISLVNQKTYGTIVIDNCNISLHRALVSEVRRDISNLALLTLDYHEDSVRSESGWISLSTKEMQDVVGRILKGRFPGLSDNEMDRVKEFAQDIPQMAVLIAESKIEQLGNLGNLLDRDLVSRLLWGRELEVPEFKRFILGCSIFDFIGPIERNPEQRAWIAQKVCEISESEFYKAKVFFEKRRIADPCGDYIRIRPLPLALQLAAEWWEGCSPDRTLEILTMVPKYGLTDALCRQIRKLDFLPRAQDLVKDLCGISGPFGQAEVLNTSGGSQIFSSFVEVNPQVAAATLFRLFGEADPQNLKAISAGRRHLVWALEKLCFRKETFPTSVRVMLNFGLGENETWGNNATNSFLHLFKILLPGTEATLKERMSVLRSLINQSDPIAHPILVNALGKALETQHFSRMGGPEVQGTQLPMKDFEPNSLEIRDYVSEAISLLTDFPSKKPEIISLTKEKLTANLRGLIAAGFVDVLNLAIKSIVSRDGSYWPDLYDAIVSTVKYDFQKIGDQTRQLLETWKFLITPKDVKEKLQLFVTNPPFDHEKNSEGRYIDLSMKRATDLADELLQIPPHSWINELAILFYGTQRQGFAFGKRLGEKLEDPWCLCSLALNILASKPDSNPNPSVLAGFLQGCQDPTVVENVLERVRMDPNLAIHFIPLASTVGLNGSHLKAIQNLAQNKKIPPEALYPLGCGMAMDHFSLAEVDPFFRSILVLGDSWSPMAFHFLYMYCHGRSDKWAEAVNLFKWTFERELVLVELSSSSHVDYMTYEVLKFLLAKEADPGFAAILTKRIIELIESSPMSFATNDGLKDVLEILFEKFPAAVWPDFGEIILNTKGKAHYKAISMVSSMFGLSSKRSPIGKLHPSILIKWCTDNSPQAPKIIAKIIPVYDGTKDGEAVWFPTALMLIDNFGQLKEVQDSFDSNLFSFSWSGSIVPHLEKEKELFQFLLNHRLKEVRQWSVRKIASLDARIKDEQEREEEEKKLGL